MNITKSNIDRYNNGEYQKYNLSWSVETSAWKSEKILNMLNENKIAPKKICELGCGAGEILRQLKEKMDDAEFCGYEISEYAYELCKTRQTKGLEFKLDDLLSDANHEYYDLLLIIDVVEHVEDYFGFLRKCKDKANYKLLHIPLEMNIQGVLRTTPLLNARKSVGHLHYFSKETAIATLKECGYLIKDIKYTHSAIEFKNRTLKNKILDIPRKIFIGLNEDLTVRLLGGSSLLVLAE
jgi:cyclopropane fatty-acyl-phospholipid synthase-like methyltransferase